MAHPFQNLRTVQPPPYVIEKHLTGSAKKLLIDDAVLEPMRGALPADEPESEAEKLIVPLGV